MVEVLSADVVKSDIIIVQGLFRWIGIQRSRTRPGVYTFSNPFDGALKVSIGFLQRKKKVDIGPIWEELL